MALKNIPIGVAVVTTLVLLASTSVFASSSASPVNPGNYPVLPQAPSAVSQSNGAKDSKQVNSGVASLDDTSGVASNTLPIPQSIVANSASYGIRLKSKSGTSSASSSIKTNMKETFTGTIESMRGTGFVLSIPDTNADGGSDSVLIQAAGAQVKEDSANISLADLADGQQVMVIGRRDSSNSGGADAGAATSASLTASTSADTAASASDDSVSDTSGVSPDGASSDDVATNDAPADSSSAVPSISFGVKASYVTVIDPATADPATTE